MFSVMYVKTIFMFKFRINSQNFITLVVEKKRETIAN